MALIKLGALAQDVRGSLNGTVFSRNRGGAYVRSKVSPLQPVSEFTAAIRQAFKATSQSWATQLTPVQRAAWIAFASVHPFVNVFGDSIILSGIAMYQAINQRLMLCGETLVLDAPLSFIVADLGDVVVTSVWAAGACDTLQIVPGRELTYEEGLYVFLTPGLPPGVKVQNPDYRLLCNQDTGLFPSGEDLDGVANERYPAAGWTTGKQWSLRVSALNKVTGAISASAVIIGTV